MENEEDCEFSSSSSFYPITCLIRFFFALSAPLVLNIIGICIQHVITQLRSKRNREA
jgi:hypothetical protein